MTAIAVDKKTGRLVSRGDTITDFRGERLLFVACYAKPAPSTGRVVVADLDGKYEREYYPGVFDLEILDSEPTLATHYKVRRGKADTNDLCPICAAPQAGIPKCPEHNP